VKYLTWKTLFTSVEHLAHIAVMASLSWINNLPYVNKYCLWVLW